MSSWADKVPWGRLIQMTLLIGGGIACLALGQSVVGVALLSAAIGQVMPNDVAKIVVRKK